MGSNSEFFGTAMTRYKEKQFYKKLLKVIEIPALGRLDMDLMQDLQFYVRFLAMYVWKMRKDWVPKDNNFHGTGGKQKDLDFYNCKLRKNRKNMIEDESLKKNIPNVVFKDGMLTFIMKRKIGLSRRNGKKWKNLWANTISLKDYKGKFDIDLNYIINRREARYKEEQDLFNQFGYYYLKKEHHP
jgi:hypothetical protein